MADFRFRMRQIGVMVAVSIQRVAIDPAQFMSLLSERIRQSNIPLSGRIASIVAWSSKGLDNQNREDLLWAAPSDSNIGVLRKKYYEDSRREFDADFPQYRSRKTYSPRGSDGEIRVLYYLNNSEPHTKSGYTVRSSGLLKSLDCGGLEIYPVTRLGYPASVGRLASSPLESSQGLNYRRLIPRVMPFYPSRIRSKAVEMLNEQIAHTPVDVLHTTTPFRNALVVAEVADHWGIPWIYEVRGQPEDTWLSKREEEGQKDARNSAFYLHSRNQETAAMQSADAVIVLSKVQKEGLIRRGIKENKIFVAPNAVDDRELEDLQKLSATRSKTSIREELGLPRERKLVGIISSLVGYEGVDVLLEAFEKLPTDVSLVVVGDGEARVELEKKAKDLRLGSNVTFVGRKPAEEIGKWYAALDLFVVPRKDTDVTRSVTPIKPVMALAIGCPVIASDLPPLREITGGLARYVAPGDSGALADAISEELADPPDQRSTEDFAEQHSWGFVSETYRHIYKQLVRLSSFR